MKKLFYAIGSALVVAPPIIITISCGSVSATNNVQRKLVTPNEIGKHTFTINYNFDEISGPLSIESNLVYASTHYKFEHNEQNEYHFGVAALYPGQNVPRDRAYDDAIWKIKQYTVDFIYKYGNIKIIKNITYNGKTERLTERDINLVRPHIIEDIQNSKDQNIEFFGKDIAFAISAASAMNKNDLIAIFASNNYNNWYNDNVANSQSASTQYFFGNNFAGTLTLSDMLLPLKPTQDEINNYCSKYMFDALAPYSQDK